MFAHAKLFDGDISKWDVSSVTNMNSMFLGATSFNGDLSKWDVSRVRDMHGMFLGATYFKRRLCQDAWIHSKAKETAMFAGTFGTIARTVCTITGTIPAFSPQSRAELKSALDSYLERAPNGDDCFTATRAAFDIGAESAINDRFLCKAACLRCTTVTHLLSTVRSRAGSGATKMLVAKILKRDDGPPQIQKILFQGMTETALRYHMRETDNIIPDDVLVSNVRYL